MGVTGWHVIILLPFVLFLVPVIGIIVSLNVRRNRIASGVDTRTEKYDTMSLVAFVLSFVPTVSIAAIVLGHLALARVKRTNDRGWGLAVSALWIGYSVTVGSALLFTAVVLSGLSTGVS